MKCSIFVLCLVFSMASALKCFQCGQYHDGVGSITPCINYTDATSSFFLKDCPRKNDKFCIKYVSELSTVRDCVESCIEKEAWGSSAFCCDQDSCNTAPSVLIGKAVLSLTLLLPILIGSITTLLAH